MSFISFKLDDHWHEDLYAIIESSNLFHNEILYAVTSTTIIWWLCIKVCLYRCAILSAFRWEISILSAASISDINIMFEWILFLSKRGNRSNDKFGNHVHHPSQSSDLGSNLKWVFQLWENDRHTVEKYEQHSTFFHLPSCDKQN